MNNILNNKFLGALAVGLLFAGTSAATMITGTIDITGTAGVSATAIDFYGTPPSCSTGPNLGSGGCFLDGIGGGSFTTDSGVNGTVQDLQGGNIVGPKSVTGFMTFANGVTFDLTSIVQATNTPSCLVVNDAAPGVTCTPGPAPSGFIFTNGSGTNGNGTANSTEIQFQVLVNGYTGTNASVTPYIGTFTTTVAGLSASDVLAVLASNNGTGIYVHGYQGSFAPVSSVPEPASMFLMGLGLIALPVVSRRFSRR